MQLPIPTNASKDAIYARAESIAAKLEFAPNGSMDAVVARLGGEIEHSDPFGDEPSESILVRGARDFTIFISALTSPKRDRFTIAHELGHYFLHYPIVRKGHADAQMHATRWVDERNDDLQRTEWEANWFAAGFLMPSDEFSRVWNDDGKDETAEYFGVSRAAADVRAKNIGLT